MVSSIGGNIVNTVTLATRSQQDFSYIVGTIQDEQMFTSVSKERLITLGTKYANIVVDGSLQLYFLPHTCVYIF